MQDVLAISILAIAGVFISLTLVIVVNKAWRETAQRRRRSRRRELEPIVLRFVHGEGASLQAALRPHLRGRDRRVLESILLDYVQRVRGIERERLSEALDEAGFADEYIERLTSRRWWSRAEAAENLGLVGARRATTYLVRALEDEVSEVRMRAAKALGTLGGTASARPLIRALDEPNRWSTIRIADILTSMGREVVDELLDIFPELSRPGKLAVLDILGRIRPLRVLNWLHERVEDPEPDVRARACHAIGSLGDPNSGPVLARALADAEWPVRAMAAKALGRVRHMESIPALCDLLRDREWWPRCNAAEALRTMGSKGVQALERMLDDEDTYARHQAVLMLEESGVVDSQVGLLARSDGDERKAAEALIRRLIRAGQTSRLGQLAGEHPDTQVRMALGQMLNPEPEDQEASP